MQPQQAINNDMLINLDEHIVRAETGKRFLNYIIDLALFYVLIVGLGILLVIVFPSSAGWMAEASSGFGIIDRLLTILFYGVYMFLIEALFKGKSLGKLITRTRAVNTDGSNISVSTALARGFSRAVPFCVFSAFGTPCNPWQDKWTDTIVMDEKQSHWKDLHMN